MEQFDDAAITLFSLISTLWPIYSAVMFALAFILFKRTNIAGASWMVIGYGFSLLLHIVSIAIAQANSLEETPGWVWSVSVTSTLLNMVCQIVVAVGF